MVRIVVYGTGKLGVAIVTSGEERAASAEPTGGSGARVVAGVDRHWVENHGSDETLPGGIPVYASLDQVEKEFDVLVDASRAEALAEALNHAVEAKLPLIIAATGHTEDQLEEIEKAAQTIPILRSSNLSVGVNVLRRLSHQAAQMLGATDVEIVETHHRMKVDAPSGTALTLAEAVRDGSGGSRDFLYGRSPDTPGKRGNEIGIHALRGGSVVGEHTVTFYLDDEIVELRHVAQTRQVFGFGALRAAEFISGQKPGLYTMEDLLG